MGALSVLNAMTQAQLSSNRWQRLTMDQRHIDLCVLGAPTENPHHLHCSTAVLPASVMPVRNTPDSSLHCSSLSTRAVVVQGEHEGL